MATRRATFRPDREPLRHTDTLLLQDDKVEGPVSFLNPTRADYEPILQNKVRTDSTVSTHVQSTTPWEAQSVESPTPNIAYRWTARNNRKGRHTLVVRATAAVTDTTFETPPSTSSPKEVRS